MWKLWTSLCAAILFTASAWTADVPALVAQLSAARFSDREAAQKQLSALGRDELPILREALRVESQPEGQSRLERVIRIISERTECDTLLAAKPISVTISGKTVEEAVKEFAKASQIPMVYAVNKSEDPKRIVTLKIQNRLPWDALEDFCRAAQLREEFPTSLQGDNNDESAQSRRQITRSPFMSYSALQSADQLFQYPVVLVDGTPTPRVMQKTGLLRIAAMPVGANIGSREPLLGSISLLLDVAAAGKDCQWVRTDSIRIDHAVTQDGRNLPMLLPEKPMDQQNPYQYQRLGGGLVRFSNYMGESTPSQIQNGRIQPIRLKVDHHPLTFFRELSGVVEGQVQQKNQDILKLENLSQLNGEKFSMSNLSSLTFQSMTTDEAKNQTTISISYSSPNLWMLQQRGMVGLQAITEDVMQPYQVPEKLVYFDENGHEMDKPLQTETSGSGDEFQTTYKFKLVYNHPKDKPRRLPKCIVLRGTKSTTCRVPFHLKNVPVSSDK